MDNPETLATLCPHDTVRRQTKQNTTQKTKKMSNTYSTKNRGWTQVLTRGRQFLLLIRHTSFASFNQILDPWFYLLFIGENWRYAVFLPYENNAMKLTRKEQIYIQIHEDNCYKGHVSYCNRLASVVRP